VEIIGQACPLFVPLVEEGELDTEITRLVAQKYLTSLKDAGIDTLVLGCTHYPLLRKVIAETMGPEVRLVDSAESAALETASLLRDRGMLHESTNTPGAESFHVTDAAARFHGIAQTFLGHDIHQLELADLGSPG
jgi:glutamate racemase